MLCSDRRGRWRPIYKTAHAPTDSRRARTHGSGLAPTSSCSVLDLSFRNASETLKKNQRSPMPGTGPNTGHCMGSNNLTGSEI